MELACENCTSIFALHGVGYCISAVSPQIVNQFREKFGLIAGQDNKDQIDVITWQCLEECKKEFENLGISGARVDIEPEFTPIEEGGFSIAGAL